MEKGMNMKNRLIPWAISYIIIILLMISVITFATKDRNAPKITFSKDVLTYTEGEDTKILLQGVKANDNEDGNVTGTITIESVRVLASGKKASVTYAARDSKNNITKASRIVRYQAAEQVPEQSDEETNTEGTTSEEVINDESPASNTEEDASDTSTESNNSEEAGQEEEATEDEPLVSTGAPIIRLNTDFVVIPVGSAFNYMNYVAEAVDDKDDPWRRIRIRGDYSTKTPGEYKLRYSITDSDGNTSNVEILTLVVE